MAHYTLYRCSPLSFNHAYYFSMSLYTSFNGFWNNVASYLPGTAADSKDKNTYPTPEIEMSPLGKTAAEAGKPADNAESAASAEHGTEPTVPASTYAEPSETTANDGECDAPTEKSSFTVIAEFAGAAGTRILDLSHYALKSTHDGYFEKPADAAQESSATMLQNLAGAAATQVLDFSYYALKSAHDWYFAKPANAAQESSATMLQNFAGAAGTKVLDFSHYALKSAHDGYFEKPADAAQESSAAMLQNLAGAAATKVLDSSYYVLKSTHDLYFEKTADSAPASSAAMLKDLGYSALMNSYAVLSDVGSNILSAVALLSDKSMGFDLILHGVQNGDVMGHDDEARYELADHSDTADMALLVGVGVASVD